MNTQPIALDGAPRIARIAQRHVTSQWDIAMHWSIRGDTQRIFNALTVPEFRETWMCVPDADAASRVHALEAGDRYQLEFHRAGCVHATVTGLYRVRKRHRLEFTWRDHSAAESTESQVRIQIEGHFGRSWLSMVHSGIADENESVWLRRMWSASMDKLAALFER